MVSPRMVSLQTASSWTGEKFLTTDCVSPDGRSVVGRPTDSGTAVRREASSADDDDQAASTPLLPRQLEGARWTSSVDI